MSALSSPTNRTPFILYISSIQLQAVFHIDFLRASLVDKPMYLSIILTVLIACAISIFQRSNYSDVLDYKSKDYGSTDGQAVILIPGLDGATAFFTDIAPELTAKGLHIVLFHLPLFSNEMKAEEYTFSYIANQLREVLDELGLQQATLVGESFGGIVAQHFALEYPDRVSKMVLLSSLAKTELPPEVQWKLDYLMPIITSFGQAFPHFAQFLFAQIHVDDVVEPFEPRFVRQLFIKEASFAHFHSVMARIRLASTLDITHRVPSIQTPTLVVYGQDDHFTKDASLQLHRLLPHSELRSLPGGHLAHVTAPKEFARLVADYVAKDT